MKKLLLSCVAFLLIICAGQALADTPPYLCNLTWTAVGPGGGGAQYSPGMAPGNPSLMFGFCDMGGIYRSTDGGHAWQMLTFDQAQMPMTYNPVHCNPAFALTNGNICFLGLSGNGLRRTTDGGVTWTQSAPGGITAVKIDAADSNVVFYADNTNHMFRSADCGSTWNEVTAWVSTVNAIADDIYIDPTTAPSSPTVYASTGNGIYKSVNGGSTWTAANSGLPSTSVSDFNGGLAGGAVVLYVSIYNYGVYKSIDGATTWTAANSGFNYGATSGYSTELGVCESNANILYVGSHENSGPTVYKSTNGASSWTMTLTDPGASNFPAGVSVARDWMTAGLGWAWGEEPHEIGVCPTDGNVVAISEDGRTWRSDDGGTNWFCCNDHETSTGSNWWSSVGFETTTNYFVHFAPWDHNRAYITYTDIGFFRSQDRGGSWRLATSGSPYNNTFYDAAFDPSTNGKMWAVASNNHDLPHEKMLRQSGFPTFTGAFLRSTDYGATWTNLGHPLGGGSNGAMTSIAVDPSSPAGNRTIYVTVMGHGVYKSTNDGVSWVAVNTGLSMPSNMNAWQIRIMPDGTLYCALTEAMTPSYVRYPGALFKSTNGGASWSKVNTSVTLPYIYGFDVDPTDQNRIYVASFQMGGSGQGIWVTTDGGTTWNCTLTGCDMSGAAIDSSNHARIYATAEQGENSWPIGGVFISEDYGSTWTKIPGMPFEHYGPNYVTFDPDDSHKIFVTTFGGGVFTTTVPDMPSGLAINTTTLPADTIGVAYSQTLTASGGVSPYTWSIASGGLPAGLSLNASSGAITGTPAATGTSSFTAEVADNVGASATQALSIVINPAPSITTSSLPSGQVGVAYNQTLTPAGGTAPLTWSVSFGGLPAGLSLGASTGAITGTPTASGTSNFTVQVADNVGASATKALSIVVTSTLTITTTTLPATTVGVAYNQTLAATGGAAPLTWAISSGSLPTGLSLVSGTGAITGTPTASGTSSFTATVTDNVGATASKALAIVVNAAPSITTSSLPDASTGTAYNQTLAATGGTTPYTWSLLAGSLPAGLSLVSSTGAITGTPSASGTSNFTAKVSDNVAATASRALAIVVTGGAQTNVTFQDGLNGYAGTTDTWLNSDYPTTNYGGDVQDHLQYTTQDRQVHRFDVSSIPSSATVNSATIYFYVYNVTGGTPAVACYRVLTHWDEMQATYNNRLTGTAWGAAGMLSGTDYVATALGTFAVSAAGWVSYDITSTVQGWVNGSYANEGVMYRETSTGHCYTRMSEYMTDASLRPKLVVAYTTGAGAPIITTPSLPADTVGVAYNQTLTATGGAVPYTWSLQSGSLPAGLSLNASSGAITGTPNASGAASFTAKVTDNVSATASKALSIVINAAVTITTSNLPADTVGVAYNQALSATGGTGVLTWSLNGGSLPTGLSLTAAGVVSGTPSVSGTTSFTAKAADTVGATAAKALSIVVNAAPSITTSSLPNGTQNVAYSQTLAATGGTTPYSWAISSGTLPTGLSLVAGTGVISGTPTATGTSSFTVMMTDTPGATATKALSITIPADLSITTASLPGGTVGTLYNQTLAATGGVSPYNWTVSSGSLPAGLSLNSSTGAMTGTPTTSGTANFTVQAADSQTPADSATKALSIVISPAGDATYQYAAADSESSTSSTAWQHKTTLTFTVNAADTYLILAMAEVKENNTSANVRTQVTIDGSVMQNTVNYPKTTSDYMTAANAKVVTLSAASHTLYLDYSSSASNRTAYIRNARIVALRKASLELNNADQGDTGNDITTTMTNYVTTTFTPATAGDYLLIWSGSFTAATTSYYTTIENRLNGVANDTIVLTNNNTGNRRAFLSANMVNLAASAQTMTIAASKSGGTSVHHLDRARVIAIRLAGSRFAGYQSAASDTEATTTSTAWQQKLTKSWSVGTAGNWLMLSSCGLADTSTSYNVEMRQQLDNATTEANPLLRTQAAANYMNSGCIDVRNLATGTRMVDVDYRSSNASGTAKIRNARLIAVPMQ